MAHSWKKVLQGGILSILFLLMAAGLVFPGHIPAAEAKQEQPTSTPDATGAYVTVTYIEPINVRSGPSSYDYPVIGSLPVGGTAPALARSPKGEWIQISFPAGPKGVGWVYAANVSLSANGLLPVVEPPPTPTPRTTPTLNPTFVAALQAVPSVTRKPTFTAPPPLDVPTFNTGAPTVAGLQMGWIIAGLGAVGLVGMVLSLLHKRGP